MARPVDSVIQFLEAEQARGVTHLHLDEDARVALREIHALSRGGAVAMPRIEPDPGRTAIVREEAPKPAPKPAMLVVEGSTRVERLESLRRQAETWAPARVLGTLRETMVFATGHPEARLMLVGEAPGHNEEREREPFVGPAGQILTKIIEAMGILRADVYISNIVKFRPATARQATNNRKPTPEEMAVCLPFVREEIKIVQPECIVALGGTAAEGLLGLTGIVTAMRGTWHDFEGIPVRVTYHPSYLLQSGGGNQTKRQVWEDMMEAMQKLGLSISEKQRGFFLPKGE